MISMMVTERVHAIARSCSQLGSLRRCNDVVRHRLAAAAAAAVSALQIVSRNRRHSTLVSPPRTRWPRHLIDEYSLAVSSRPTWA